MADGRVQVLSQSAYKRIKEDAARRAEERLAHELGFDDVDAMRSKLRAAAEPAARPAAAAPTDTPSVDRAAGAAGKRWEHERDELTKRATSGEKSARAARQRVEELEADMAIREMLISSGVKKVGLGVHMLHDMIADLSEDEIGKLSTPAIIEGWKRSDPWLFGTVEKPATTGPGTGAPAAAQPGATAADLAAKGKTDCANMSPAEFAQYLKDRKIQGTDHVPDLRQMRK